jgi:Ca2+-binding RTX toxin-like protein
MPIVSSYPGTPVIQITARVGDKLQLYTDGYKYDTTGNAAGNGHYHISEEFYPDGGYFGTPLTLTYLVPDAPGHIDFYSGFNVGYSNIQHYAVTVLSEDGSAPQQSAPIAHDDYFVVKSGTSFSFNIADVLVNDLDAENDVLNVVGFEIISQDGYAYFDYSNISSERNFTVFQNRNLPGELENQAVAKTVELEYTVTDHRGGISTARVHVEFTPAVNDVEQTPTGSYVRGTAGVDTLDYASATSRVLIAALDGNDTLRGGVGSDALNGGAGNDIITGAAGNDSITGGLGADRMGGGAGNDTFHIALGDLATRGATDLIVDFQGAGQLGGDVIRFTGFAAGSTLDLIGTSGNARVYEVHDTAGLSEGQILVSAGGALGQVLTTSDYAFA